MVFMVDVGDEEEEIAHVYPIAYAELLSGENFNCLEGRQKLGHSGHPIKWTI
jgi:hypothetical protein